MKEQFRILTELQKVEEKVLRLQSELEKIPRQIAQIDEKIEARKEGYYKAKSTLDEVEKRQRRVETDLKEKEDLLRKSEAKMMEVKTNEELQAASKENENQKVEKAKLEESLTALMAQVDTAKKGMEEADKAFQIAQSDLIEEKKQLEDERKKLATHHEELSVKRSTVKTGLNPSTLAIFDRLSGRIKGQAIAVAENGLCTGCHMRVQPQLYNEMLGFKAVHRCGSCGRLLVVRAADETTDAE